MAKIRCRCCGGVAESRYRHDWQPVPGCPRGSFVDGGDAYLRCGGALEKIDVWTERGWVPLLTQPKEEANGEEGQAV